MLVAAAIGAGLATLFASGRPAEGAAQPALPLYAPGVTIPVVYNFTNGELRVVSPFRVAGETIPDCRPPAPWDTVNVPASGWSTIACNAGGSFDARANEYFTELAGAATRTP